MRSIDTLIIHHSASDVDQHDDVRVITKWHKARGFDECGYHYYINKEGIVSIGRKLSKIGAHCSGYNYTSIGICVGGLTGITPQQRESLGELCIDLVNIFYIKRENIFLHRDLAKTLCPSFDIEWLIFKIFKLNIGGNMPENEVEVVKKANWKKFGMLAWEKGLKSCLKELSQSTSNNWDNLAIDMLDGILKKVLK